MEVVDLKAYWEQVSRFSQYPEDRRADGYALGLLAEAGEVCGVVDKWLRNKYDEAEMKRRLVDELGDLMWYFTACLSLSRGGLPDFIAFYPRNRRGNLQINRVYDVSEMAGKVLYAMRFLSTRTRLPGYLEILHYLATYADTTLQAVLENNVAKLTERYG